MKPAGMKATGAVLAVIALLIGIWVGTRFHSKLPATTRLNGAVRTPVGEASPPTARDANPNTLDTPPTPNNPNTLNIPNADAPPPAAAKIPARLPAFTLRDRNGNATPVATWAGKSLVLNFWATWCAPCRREIPLLKALSTEWGRRGVEVVGIAVDYPDKVAAYADDLKIPYPLLIGEEDALDVAAQFGVDTPVFPFTVFTDRAGQVVTVYIGELHEAQAQLILLAVQHVDDGQISLGDAQRDIAAGLQALAADGHS